MFDRSGNYLLPAISVGKSGAYESLVVGLGTTAGENDLSVLRARMLAEARSDGDDGRGWDE